MFFSLKDSNSQVRCVIFKGNVSKLRFQMQEGLNLIVRGSVSAYIPRGEYQINLPISPARWYRRAFARLSAVKNLTSSKGIF
ncbi:exodeoxyribonuclease VII large subunit [Helicobacter cinaedi]|uniref:exodeoxyribonuclease VII large subunit n=1 Tax=Helicobacter cinaedi TaxID=213 RepID=UPI001E4B8B9A|nr:exodeoxyribonuclease VII large subunit [Helicobacter cinaedi]